MKTHLTAQHLHQILGPGGCPESRNAVSHLCNGDHRLVGAGGLFDPCLGARLSTLPHHRAQCLDHHRRLGSFLVQLDMKKSQYSRVVSSKISFHIIFNDN